jgi:hypothetical protein
VSLLGGKEEVDDSPATFSHYAFDAEGCEMVEDVGPAYLPIYQA